MKARPFPSTQLVLLLAVLMCFTCVPGLATKSAEAKVRPEVQLGDPTDTDPGPAPGPPKTTQKELARRFDVGLMNGEHRHFSALARWISLVLAGYRKL